MYEVRKTLRHSRKEILRHSRKEHSVIPAKNIPSFPQRTFRHSREGGNPQFPRMREFIVPLPRRPNTREKHSAIPAKKHSSTPAKKYSAIPAKNIPSFPQKNIPSFPRMREFIVPLPRRPNTREKHSDTPAKKYSAIPAKNIPSFPQRTFRHSREGGNPQFPRMREFIVPLPRRPNTREKHSDTSAKKYSAIPAKNIPSFPPSRE